MTATNIDYLLDSSILIPMLRKNRAFTNRANALPRRFVSPTIIAEITFGALRSHTPQQGIQDVQTLLNPFPVVDITADIGRGFAMLKNNLVATNLLIPEPDIWIAVTAISYTMRLVARDAHFQRVVPYGLDFEQW